MSTDKKETASNLAASNVGSNFDNRLRILVFTSESSGAGEIFVRYFEQVAEQHALAPPSIIYVEKSPELAKPFGLDRLPTTILLYQRKIIDRFEGILSRKKLRQRIEDNITELQFA